MLMVIFGAGASYDSWFAFPPQARPLSASALRPPLANQLFLAIPLFLKLSKRYSQCQPLLPYFDLGEKRSIREVA